jgi:hypothetical protein
MTALRRDRHTVPSMDSEGDNLFGRGLACRFPWNLSLSGGGECTKCRPFGNHDLKPQTDLVGGRQLSRDLWLLSTGLCRRPGRQADA